MAEQTSCKKPGKVNSAVLKPPPMVSFPSINKTDKPDCCKVIAAAKPLGPDPTTTASKSRFVNLFYLSTLNIRSLENLGLRSCEAVPNIFNLSGSYQMQQVATFKIIHLRI